MKKIFAIALALVMVLSMASAFASQCVTGPFDWSCTTKTTNCAKATVEVIPYVTTNSACNEVSYVESDCAAAINGENVYFAIKFTVPADIDREWMDISKLSLSVKGMDSVNGKKALDGDKFVDGFKGEEQLTAAKIDALLNEDKSEDGWVYYYVINDSTDLTKKWFEATEDEDFDIAKVMNKAVVSEYAKAKVCATIESKNEFTKGTVGDYTVYYHKSADKFEVEDEDGNYVTFYMDAKDKIYNIEATMLSDCKTEYALINEVLAFLNLGCGYGVCVTEDAIKANFGWSDKLESCYSWKTQNAMAVVDTECVVAIPKTGDASVLAWLF